VLIHGHCDPEINAAVREQMEARWQIGAPEWDLGYRMADLLRDRPPRSTRSASSPRARRQPLRARIARAYGRTRWRRRRSYHGTADVLLAGTRSSVRPGILPGGVPARIREDIVEIPSTDPDGARRCWRRKGPEIAACWSSR